MIPKLPPYKYDPDFDVETVWRPQTPWHTEKPLIDPHGNRTVSMIEIGKKGVASMRETSDDFCQLQKYIQDGQLEVITYSDMYNDNNKIVYRPELKEDAEKLLAHFMENIDSIINKTHISEERMIEKHKEMGKILGYPQKHIDYFCYGRLESKISQIRKNSLSKEENKESHFTFIKLI